MCVIYTLDDFSNWRQMVDKNIYADALQLLKVLPNKSVFVLTDPPYGLNYAKRGQIGDTKIIATKRYKKKDWDSKTPDPEVFQEIERVSKGTLIFGANYMQDKMFGAHNFEPLKRKEFDAFIANHDNWIVWDKMNSDSHFKDCEMIWTNFIKKSEIVKYLWHGMLQGSGIGEGKHRGNKNFNEVRYHITQKPLILMNYLIRRFVPPGEIVVDIYKGASTTDKSCQELGYPVISCDNDLDFCKIRPKRLSFVPMFTV